MRKSIVLIETPHICHECPLHDGDECILIGDVTDDDSVDLRCPLKPMPQKKEVDEDYRSIMWWDDDCDTAYDCGYNSCLYDILGENE